MEKKVVKGVIVYRNGVEKLRVPVVEEKNGTLRHGKGIILNTDLIPAGKKDDIMHQIKLGNITPDIVTMGIHIGDNGNGLIARWADDVDAAEQVLPEAEKERNKIEQLYTRVYRALNHDTDEDALSSTMYILFPVV